MSKKITKEMRAALAAVGAIGGSSTSDAKAKAVRENGKLGGRPKGSKSKPKQ